MTPNVDTWLNPTLTTHSRKQVSLPCCCTQRCSKLVLWQKESKNTETYVKWIGDHAGFGAICCQGGGVVGDELASTCIVGDRRREGGVVSDEQTDHHDGGEQEDFVAVHFRMFCGGNGKVETNVWFCWGWLSCDDWMTDARCSSSFYITRLRSFSHAFG